MIFAKFLIFIIIFLFWSPMAFAYGQLSNVEDPTILPEKIHFKKWQQLPIKIKVDGGSLAGQDGVALVREAVSVWNQVPQARQVFDENIVVDGVDYTLENLGVDYGLGFTGNESAASDGIVEVVFDADGAIFSALFGESVQLLGLGITIADFNTGEIVDGILLLNGTIPSSKEADLLATMVHELGHILGLTHTTVGAQNKALLGKSGIVPEGLQFMEPAGIPTMWWSAIYPDDRLGRSLALDDMLGLIHLYGE